MKNIMNAFLSLALIIGLFSAPAAMAQDALVATIISPNEGQNLTINEAFDFSATANGGNAPYAFVWNFGDGTGATGQNYSKTYTSTGSRAVTLTVTDFSGSQASASRNINVISAPSGAPVVDFRVNGGNGPITIATTTVVNLSWTTTDATACTASGAWSGSKPLTGSESVTVSMTSTFTLTCTGPGGTGSDSVTVNLSSDPDPVAPVISNIRVTDITQTTAIVRWDTNIPADSRVIYDTVSHPTLGVAPNYGYAFSSNTQDTSPKVTDHAVQLTDLSSNTQYFFRVLSQS